MDCQGGQKRKNLGSDLKENSTASPISRRTPDFNFWNFVFILRYFLRAAGSLAPPAPIKNFFYRLAGIRIGRNVFIGESVYFVDGCVRGMVDLQEEAVLSPKVVLVAMAVPYRSFLQREYQVVKVGKITIGRGAWLGVGCVVLPGVTVGEGAIVGANAVVNTDVPSFEVWAGNPARFIKKVSDYGKPNGA